MNLVCNITLEHEWRGGGEAAATPAGMPVLGTDKSFVTVRESRLVGQVRTATLGGAPLIESRVRVRLSAPLLDDLILAREDAMSEPGPDSGRVQEALREAIEVVLLYALDAEGLPSGWKLTHSSLDSWSREADNGKA